MTVTFIDNNSTPNYLAMSTDVDSGTLPGASRIGGTVYLIDTAEWKIVLDDLTLDDYVFP
jgi:hypothetical protein